MRILSLSGDEAIRQLKDLKTKGINYEQLFIVYPSGILIQRENKDNLQIGIINDNEQPLGVYKFRNNKNDLWKKFKDEYKDFQITFDVGVLKMVGKPRLLCLRWIFRRKGIIPFSHSINALEIVLTNQKLA